MNKNSLIFLISLLTMIATVPASTGRRGGMMVGNYRPIPDLNDPHVQEIAKYAISAHNKIDGTKLEYVKVVKGESQVVSGTNYRLQISANDNGSAALRDYLAVVYEKAWQNYKNLTSFNAL